MTPIVTGFYCSGTSMLMQMLIESGYPAYYSQKREDSQNRLSAEPNPCGYWEHPEHDYMTYGFGLRIPQGHCCKVPIQGLPTLSGGAYQVIAMRRDPAIIKASYIRKYGLAHWNKQLYANQWPNYYYNIMTHNIDIIRRRRDMELIEMDYNYMVDRPMDAVKELRAFGAKLSLDVVSIPDKQYRKAG